MPKTSTAHMIFSHLTPEERIDQACELLAIGVRRLATKEGLVQSLETESSAGRENISSNELHHDSDSSLAKETA
ncbi:MAG: hypothetical protein A3G33_07540 [Omnitrophica bacterium RIFCSPLOWO2_12_FULL_44_17]|uniref:Uncharacterized protein n=1 Tax=Candidatus Danuiimicrobium aquiferis TaxID=1801832 RepID=A0A1G1KYZ6_9BACT|nr:MAG: hypothetical protein A3B72_07840 [Omnitrophica bacterium RIFCSPHIGHO2_02_FULL_45_28]OGW92150.1 MAG: hypothetical protein A3E74_10300 [Omnitrophica bacterium RIFCSPHIGHO2_12_FULL_44_12]OGW98072.1 MAG: hypothetical protein A3G33_07540 [Omnitrophica bacterium RIFCSPLOWO2_12_FULL_44_17]OGX03486.1 MAG: hypothetical protein A3J12_02685 [Omnitrophica bacterium RIFCSPLOWO2_02_FULL_44_11]